MRGPVELQSFFPFPSFELKKKKVSIFLFLASYSTATHVSPLFSTIDYVFFLPTLSAYLAKAADRADLTVNSGSLFLPLFAFSVALSSSFSTLTERGSALSWTGVSETAGRLETTRLNGS
jgi:hypothetical protein